MIENSKKILNVIELFSGSGTISKEFREAGHKVFSVDIRKRKGVCEPSLRKDIMKLRQDDIPFERVDMVWASPPCDVFSHAGGSFHIDKEGKVKTQKARDHIEILKKTLRLIGLLKPKVFFIENPRGRMRTQKEMIDFLIKNNAMIKELTYSSYGSSIIKPTNLFTNALSYNPRSLGKFGRGARNEKDFNNMTKVERQKIPDELAKEIREYCEKNILRDGF